MLTVLRQRNFALLWFGQLISLTGDYVLIVALPFYTYQLTGSVLDTGLMFFVQGLPGLLLGSMAGVFVDRWNRRHTMIAADLLRAAVLLLLLFVHSRSLVWVIYVVAFVEQVVSQFFFPAKGAIIPHLVEEPQLIAANSLNSTSDAITRLVGPPLGGAMLAIFGLTSVVFIDSASYLISGIMILLIVMPRSIQTEKQATSFVATWIGFWRDWLDGLQLVLRERLLIGLFLTTCFVMFGQGIINVLIVVFVEAVLHGNASTFGLLITFQGIGSLVGAVLVGQFGRHIKPAYLLALTAPAGLLLWIILNFPHIILALVLISIIGVLFVAFLITEQTLFQTHVADVYRGRILGAYGATCSLLYIIGIICSSFLSNLLGVIGTLDIAAALLVCTGVTALFLLHGIPIRLANNAEEVS